MNNQLSAPTNTATTWTWADQISTYRFWGLVIFNLLTLISFITLSSFMAIFLRDEIGVQLSETGIIFVMMAVGGLLGFYLGWAAARWKTVLMLIVAGGLQLLGGLFIATPSLASVQILLWIGAFLFGLGTGTITLAIPSAIAGGRGGAETFVISFGIIFLVTRIGELYAPALMGILWERIGPSVLGWTIVIYTFIGLLFLLPVNPSLFNEPPRQRGYSLTPTNRNPILVAIMCLIPFYWLYWLYRAHGEIASFAPARNILSPRASVFAAFFIPFFIYPVLMTTLNDAVNKQAIQSGKPRHWTSWVIFMCAFFIYPVGMALVQSSINRVIGELNLQEHTI